MNLIIMDLVFVFLSLEVEYHIKLRCTNSGNSTNISGLFWMNTQFVDFTHRSALNENTLTALVQGVGFKNVCVSQVLLPKSPANWMRERMRRILFKLARVSMKIVGATPVKILTHLMIVSAQKEKSPNQ